MTQLLTSWDKTHADPALEVKGVATLNAMPLCLVSSNAQVKTVADFTPRDRIAVVAVRTSIEAVVLSMAAGSGPAAAPVCGAVIYRSPRFMRISTTKVERDNS